MIAARFLHKEFFEFKNTAKIIVAANYKPKIAGTDYGIWRRIKLVPFQVTIPEGNRIIVWQINLWMSCPEY